MGLFNHFPYPDTHQLNLDWILDAVKSCVNKVTDSLTDIQKALTDAQAAATSAQASAASAQTSATGAQASAASAKTSATGAQASAANAQTSANVAQESANLGASYLNDMQTMMGKLYPIGAVYVNYRDQTQTAESDATVIARLKSLTGGTWVRAGSHGQPVPTSGPYPGWATVILGNAAGDANDINFNIYVRTV